MLKRGRQDLVEELAGPHWYLDRKGEVPEGEKPYFRLPILNYHQVAVLQACSLGISFHLLSDLAPCDGSRVGSCLLAVCASMHMSACVRMHMNCMCACVGRSWGAHKQYRVISASDHLSKMASLVWWAP